MNKQDIRFNEDTDNLGGIPSSGYVKKAGDTMTGALKGIAPADGDDLTRKDYVDDNFFKDTTRGDIEQDPAVPSHSLILARVGLPGGSYHYIFTYKYGSGGNMGQLALPYGNGSSGTHTRYKYSDVWSEWDTIGASANPAEILLSCDNSGATIYDSQNVASVTDTGEGALDVIYAAPVPNVNYYAVGNCADASESCNGQNGALVLRDKTTAQISLCMRNFDGDAAANNTAEPDMRVLHTSATAVYVADDAPMDTNVGVIENLDGTIKVAQPAKGYTVQDAFDRMSETGVLVLKTSVPTNRTLRSAWRLDSVTPAIYVDLTKAKEIVVGIVEKVVAKQLADMQPAFNEAFDNDDTALMNQIKIDRADIRDELSDKVADINAATTVAEVEGYLP